jgi:hypothetical protein
MSDGQSTVDIAWNNLLRAEHGERMARNWAPSKLDNATKARVAAARSLHRMGVDISAMRRERIDAAVAFMASELAAEGVRATVRRSGTRILVESPDIIGQTSNPVDGFIAWAKARGVAWRSSSWHGGAPASVLVFALEVPNQEPFPYDIEDKATESDDERRVTDAAEQVVLDLGRSVVGLLSRSPACQRTSSEELSEVIERAFGNGGPNAFDWRDWSG